MAEKRTIEIDIKNNAPKTEQDFKNLNSTMDSTAKANDQVNRSFNTGATFAQRYGEELQPLTTRMGEAEDRLYELALAGDTTSKEYQELLEKVGAYRKVQMQTDLAVDGASQTFLQKLAPALNGVTSAYLATQGALTLFGKENEQLNETLVKVQGALAIQQGVQGLTEAYKQLSIGTKLAGAAQATFAFVTGAASTAMKVFRLALVGTGIGAIVIAVGALIANFDKIGPVVKKVMQIALIPMKTIVDGLVAAYYALTDALGITSKAERDREKQAKQHAAAQKKRNTELMDAYNKEKQAIQDNIDATRRYQKAQENRYDKQIELLEAEGKDTRKLEKLKRQLAVDTAKQILQDRIKGLKEVQKTNNSFAKMNAKILLAAAKNDLEEAQFQELKFDKETNKLKLDNYRNYAKDRLDIARQIEDLENSLLKDGIDKELEINRDKFRRLREDAERNTKLTLDERERLNDLYTEQEAKSEGEIRNKFRKESLQEEIDFFTENKLPVLQAQADKEVEVEITKWSLIGQAQKKAFDEEKARRKEINAFVAETAMQTLDVVNEFAQLRADKFENLNQQILDNEKLTDKQKEKMLAENNRKAKKAFQVQKAASIASALITTYQSAVSAYQSQFLPVPDPSSPVRGGIAAGLAVAGGLANVANISRQKFEGASIGGGGDTGAPDLSGGGAIAPSFNVVGDSSVNQLAQLQQTPTQAFVVSGEVTSAQALDRNRVTNATL